MDSSGATRKSDRIPPTNTEIDSGEDSAVLGFRFFRQHSGADSLQSLATFANPIHWNQSSLLSVCRTLKTPSSEKREKWRGPLFHGDDD
jgi:hypothetical protein